MILETKLQILFSFHILFVGGHNLSSCAECTPGFYCKLPGLNSPTAECDPGWYCTLGSALAKPTDPEGGKCLAGTILWPVKVDIFQMKINIVVTDVVNYVTYSRKSVNSCVVRTLLLHDVIHWKTATSYDKH